MEVGLALGAYQFEFDRLLGGMSAVDGGKHLRELVPAVRALWEGDYAHDGEVWQFPTSTSVPKPLQKPTPPMWIAARDISSHDLYFDDRFRMLVVMFPPESLQLSRRDLASLTASRVSGRQGLGLLTSTLLCAMGQQLREGPVPGAVSASDAVLSLVSAVFAERIDSGSPQNSQRRVLLARIHAYISSHLGDPELTVTDVAAAHHISVRYLQKLFEEHGESGCTGASATRQAFPGRSSLPSARRRPNTDTRSAQ